MQQKQQPEIALVTKVKEKVVATEAIGNRKISYVRGKFRIHNSQVSRQLENYNKYNGNYRND